MKHKRLIIPTALLFVIIIFCVFILTLNAGLISIWKGEFTKEGWSNFPWLRHKIVSDMEAKIDIWNLSEAEMQSILGSADEEYINSRGDGFSQYNYIIKTRSSVLLFSDLRFYAVTFADDGKVVKVSILRAS